MGPMCFDDASVALPRGLVHELELVDADADVDEDKDVTSNVVVEVSADGRQEISGP